MVGYAVSGSRSAREQAARRGSFLIHSSTSPTKLLRPQELMSSTENDALEPLHTVVLAGCPVIAGATSTPTVTLDCAVQPAESVTVTV